MNEDLRWSVQVHGKPVDSKCCALDSLANTVKTKHSLHRLVQLVDGLNICAGHPEQQFLDLADSRKGIFQSVKGSRVAFVDSYYPVQLNRQLYSRTVRTTACDLLVHGVKCTACKEYRSTLRSLHSRKIRPPMSDSTAVSSHSNIRYLRTPERKKRIAKLKAAVDSKTAEVNRKTREIECLKLRLNKATEQNGIHIEEQLENDLTKIMEEKTNEICQMYPSDSFQHLFWKQQLESLKVKDKRQIKWHPMMIRWCLSLKLISSASYHALRSSNLIVLPSERTLRDYTHFIKAKPGFQPEIDEQLCREANIDSIPEYQKYVCLVFDEVKVKEDLVYDKHSANLLGFVQIGDINDHLSDFERMKSSEVLRPQLATHILTFMVCGILSDLEFPYVSFPCSSITGDQLYPLVWGCIRRLEACGFKVLALTCDGASTNRTFLKLHQFSNDDVVYKTTNPYADEDRPLFFISDPPHLIKTVRNCWANSYGHSWSRKMCVSMYCV